MTDVAIYIITEQSVMPSFISVLSHWTDGVSDGLYCMIMTQHFILCECYYCSYTDFCDMYWLVVSWSGGHNYMDLVVSCNDVLMSLLRLGSCWSTLIGFTLLMENRGSHSHHCLGLLVLASFFMSPPIHYLPVLFSTWLTSWLMAWRTFSPTRTFVGQASLFILCLGSELVT